jgi:protein TonB
MASNLIHLFNSARKSSPREGRPVRLSPTTPNDVFLTALLETPTTKTARRSPLEWAAATSLHIVILATLIIVPLYTTGTIQLDKYADTLLVAPPPAPPPPPPAAGRAIVPHTTVTRPKLTYTLGKLTAPASIPKTISSDNAAAAPDLAGVPGGVPGGQPGGSLGGVIGGTGTSIPIPTPQQPAAKRILRVGSNLKAPRQILSVQPEYPELARQAHVWGDVVVDAVIDERGNVVRAHAVSGHPVLIPAALQAVLQWKYQPTLLNGTPLAVEMEVTVHFNLGNS